MLLMEQMQKCKNGAITKNDNHAAAMLPIGQIRIYILTIESKTTLRNKNSTPSVIKWE